MDFLRQTGLNEEKMDFPREKCRKMVLHQPQNPPAILYNTIFDCDRILRIARRFFWLQSRLRICNPLQSPCNPPNPIAIQYNQDCKHFSQSYTISRIQHNPFRLWEDCDCGCNIYAEQGNAAIEGENLFPGIAWTIKVDAQSKQQKLYVFIFCNPVAIQFFFFAILSDCNKIAGLHTFL